jgi:hypothetical protein
MSDTDTEEMSPRQTTGLRKAPQADDPSANAKGGETSFSNFNGRADTDPMFINYVGAMTYSFQNKPFKSTMAYEVYKSIFIQDRSKFTVISKLHQNNAQDHLHFSVKVDVINCWFHTLHYNGWWDGDRFMLQNITAMTMNRDRQEVLEVIAVFHQ